MREGCNLVLNWNEVSKCDPRARVMANHHYTYRPVKSRVMGKEVGPSGQKIVLLTADGKAVWGSHRPAPWTGIKRMDGFDGVSCFIFRNEGCSVLSSNLIREAVGYTVNRWGVSAFLTYVGVECVSSDIPGYCFIRAGFKGVGYTHSSKIGWMRKLVMSPNKVGMCWVEWLERASH